MNINFRFDSPALRSSSPRTCRGCAPGYLTSPVAPATAAGEKVRIDEENYEILYSPMKEISLRNVFRVWK